MDMITLKDCIEFINKQCEEAGVEPYNIQVRANPRPDVSGIFINNVEFCVTLHKDKDKRIEYTWRPEVITLSHSGEKIFITNKVDCPSYEEQT
jgi:hypothetical protein